MSVPEQPSPHHASPGDGVTALSAPVETAWRRLSARLPVVRGRLAGTVLVLVAVLCAAPATVWPVHTVVYQPPPDEAYSAPSQHLALWSWGRLAYLGTDAAQESLDLGNPTGLVLLVAVLLVGVAAGACYGLRRGSDGVLLGAVGTSWLAAHLAADAGQTSGRLWSGFYGTDEGMVRATTAVGVLHFAAIALLLAALVVMAWRPVLRLVSATATKVEEVARRARKRAADDEAGAAESLPRVGIARMRDVEPGREPFVRPGRSTGHWSDGGDAGVGFSDEPGRDGGPQPGSDPARFQPPR